MKMQAQHGYIWYASTSGPNTHLCKGIPMAMLGYKLRDSTLICVEVIGK